MWKGIHTTGPLQVGWQAGRHVGVSYQTFLSDSLPTCSSPSFPGFEAPFLTFPGLAWRLMGSWQSSKRSWICPLYFFFCDWSLVLAVHLLLNKIDGAATPGLLAVVRTCGHVLLLFGMYLPSDSEMVSM